jgi:hypothetical protein
MAISVAKASIIEDIWKIFYDREVAIVTSVTGLSCTMPDGTHTASIKTYASSFNDKILSNISNYPIIIVESPGINSEYYTVGKDKYIGDIDVEVYANQAETADKFLSKIIDAIETYRLDLRNAGIKSQDNNFLTGTDKDNYTRGDIRVHMRRATFSFELYFNKT